MVLLLACPDLEAVLVLQFGCPVLTVRLQVALTMSSFSRHEVAMLQVNSISDYSVAVYTPALLDPEAGLRTFNITLPEGTFCSDTMVDPSKYSSPAHSKGCIFATIA